MKTHFVKASLFGIIFVFVFVGCATTTKPKPYDYTNYRAYPPRSILVLPPLNESTDIKGTYSYLSTVTRPIAEMGYYVYPVVAVDLLFKENGMPTAVEMHQAPLNKILEIIGADAVLYVTLKQYGTKYHLVSSATTVVAVGKLVDTRTGTVLWDGTLMADEVYSGVLHMGYMGCDLISVAVVQAINKSMDYAHDVSRMANAQFTIKDHGLLYGPYHPRYGNE